VDGSSGVLLSLVASAGGGIDVAGTSDALAEDRSALAVIAVRSVSGLGRVLGDVGDGGAPYALAGPADAVGGGAGIDLDGVAVPAGSVALKVFVSPRGMWVRTWRCSFRPVPRSDSRDQIRTGS
jgi:hypothetical protein